VGFGKTEVALRAAFKCALGGRQVAILALTTVLAQHITKFPPAARPLARVRRVCSARLPHGEAEGRCPRPRGRRDRRHRGRDARGCSPDGTTFARLGLVIIDEEQRFGVRHKERWKQLRTEVDVLTLSATPIPRTLLPGARRRRATSSVIETAAAAPPAHRAPSCATTTRGCVRDAVHGESWRGGQVFYLHNRVETIEARRRTPRRSSLPEARIVVGHGQMPAGELEERDGARSSARRARRAGLHDDHRDRPRHPQLPTRSSSRAPTASAWPSCTSCAAASAASTGRPTPTSSCTAMPRAGRDGRPPSTAIRQHNQLGAGFRIAMRDLELRGAGNILGRAQSGRVANVGFDLYCQASAGVAEAPRGRGRGGGAVRVCGWTSSTTRRPSLGAEEVRREQRARSPLC
jgi:transcription-repair coupling factor (superfamily II helicase)